MGRCCKSSEVLARKNLPCLEETIGRNMNVKGDSGEHSGGNEEHAITGNWRKGYPCYKLAKNLAELCFSVQWKEELASDEIKYLVEEISNKNVEDAAWHLLTTYSKM